jgi:hypothetical protein
MAYTLDDLNSFGVFWLFLWIIAGELAQEDRPFPTSIRAELSEIRAILSKRSKSAPNRKKSMGAFSTYRNSL